MKSLLITLSLSLVLGLGIIWLVNPDEKPTGTDSSEPTYIDGKQLVEIKAKGGYSPKKIMAKAGIPTVFRVTTAGTYDCSSAFTIPSLNYRTNLPPSGKTDIEIPPQAAGSTLQGMCAMGMYNFSVSFN